MRGGEVDCMTSRTKFFFDIVHMKIVKSKIELVADIVVSSYGWGFSAVFQMKFIVVMSRISSCNWRHVVCVLEMVDEKLLNNSI